LSKTALIIGVTGQDGAYLARLLLRHGYRVHGSSRDVERANLSGLAALGVSDDIALHSLSPIDFGSVIHAIERVQPDEIYNLSGQSSVGLSFAQPTETIESITLGTLNLLESLRLTKSAARFYNAGSSECFGDTGRHPANELTAFRPRSPYGVAKASAISLVANYRESYDLYACNGILFNHESSLRPSCFVTRKITSAAARIAKNRTERLTLGNLDICRDWGWAPDYVEAMWMMLQQQRPDDFVVATGIAHSLEEFVAAAFAEVGLDWHAHVDLDPALRRPSDIAFSVGDAAKAAHVLSWRPKLRFSEIVTQLIRAEQGGVAGGLEGHRIRER
jgi:GDPmannose 4,6-dehydratase